MSNWKDRGFVPDSDDEGDNDSQSVSNDDNRNSGDIYDIPSPQSDATTGIAIGGLGDARNVRERQVTPLRLDEKHSEKFLSQVLFPSFFAIKV
jgi:hypothetical protein